MAKMKINFKGFDSVLKTINEMGLNAHGAMEKALLDCHELVTKQIREAVRRGVVVNTKNGTWQTMINLDKTNELKDSLYSVPVVNWTGETASIMVGFDQDKSMHATYLMITGNPYMTPSKELYNAIYGTKTKKAIRDIQEKALMQVIEGGVK